MKNRKRPEGYPENETNPHTHTHIKNQTPKTKKQRSNAKNNKRAEVQVVDSCDVGVGLVHRTPRKGGGLAQQALQCRGPALASEIDLIEIDRFEPWPWGSSKGNPFWSLGNAPRDPRKGTNQGWSMFWGHSTTLFARYHRSWSDDPLETPYPPSSG